MLLPNCSFAVVFVCLLASAITRKVTDDLSSDFLEGFLGLKTLNNGLGLE